MLCPTYHTSHHSIIHNCFSLSGQVTITYIRNGNWVNLTFCNIKTSRQMIKCFDTITFNFFLFFIVDDSFISFCTHCIRFFLLSHLIWTTENMKATFPSVKFVYLTHTTLSYTRATSQRGVDQTLLHTTTQTHRSNSHFLEK